MAVDRVVCRGVRVRIRLDGGGRPGRSPFRAQRGSGERTPGARTTGSGAADRARLKIWATGSSETVDYRRFGFTIINHGKATAHDIRVWLADKDGKDVSVSQQPLFALAPDESDDTHGIPVPLDLDPLDLRFFYCWKDGAGYNVRPSSMPPMP